MARKFIVIGLLFALCNATGILKNFKVFQKSPVASFEYHGEENFAPAIGFIKGEAFPNLIGKKGKKGDQVSCPQDLPFLCHDAAGNAACAALGSSKKFEGKEFQIEYSENVPPSPWDHSRDAPPVFGVSPTKLTCKKLKDDELIKIKTRNFIYFGLILKQQSYENQPKNESYCKVSTEKEGEVKTQYYVPDEDALNDRSIGPFIGILHDYYHFDKKETLNAGITYDIRCFHSASDQAKLDALKKKKQEELRQKELRKEEIRQEEELRQELRKKELQQEEQEELRQKELQKENSKSAGVNWNIIILLVVVVGIVGRGFYWFFYCNADAGDDINIYYVYEDENAGPYMV